MFSHIIKRTLVLSLLVSLVLIPVQVKAFPQQGDHDENRTRLLAYMVRQNLARGHYSHAPIDDELSEKAFDLYLKQLDYQKRFLLKEDVEKLGAYSRRIDDELNRVTIELPQIAASLMEKRVEEARGRVAKIMEMEFDFSRKEQFETDPEKLDYCQNEKDLADRWRKILKYQVITKYLNLLEDEGAEADGSETEGDADKAPAADLRAKAREKVRKSFEDFFSRLQKDQQQDYLDRYFDAVARAFDPHTGYMPPTQKEDFDISMRGSLEGIGATLREEDGYIKVVSIIPGSASYRQGQLQAEDIILKVAQGSDEPVDVTDTRLREAVGLIRGKKGTEVRLTVKHPDGTRVVIPIIRDVVQIEETFVKSALLSDEAGKRNFGYIKIPSFYRDFKGTSNGGTGRNCTDDVRAELEKFATGNIEGLILDLRNNGGGALADAVRITGLFIEKGPVVQVKRSDGKTQVLEDQDREVVYSGPMVVLVNKFSASASEILAGALQDYGRAVVIGGEHTHGKGTVQSIVDLNNSIPFPNMDKYKPLGAMKVTIQKFYRVSGGSTQYRGVEPDIILPDAFQHVKSGEKFLDNSLPWDTVAATQFKPWKDGVDFLDQLRTRSRLRSEKSEAFVEIAQESELAKERREMTLQSLNIDDIRGEREKARGILDSEAPEGHGHSGSSDVDEKGKAVSEEQKRKEWLEQVNEDPYAREAMFVLDDIIALDGGAGAGKAAVIH